MVAPIEEFPIIRVGLLGISIFNISIAYRNEHWTMFTVSILCAVIFTAGLIWDVDRK